jgi:hypothetical protein
VGVARFLERFGLGFLVAHFGREKKTDWEKMANKILLAFIIADALFLITGAIELGFSLVVQNSMFESPTDGPQAARNLLYQRFPLTAGIINAILIFATFLSTIPGIITPTRGWLKLSGWLVVANTLFTLSIGIFLWILSLRTKAEFFPIWSAQNDRVKDLMQTSFSCCGYFNSTAPAFVTDDQCTSPAAAALQRGCASPLSSFLNVFIDDIFTAVFGMVGMCMFT